MNELLEKLGLPHPTLAASSTTTPGMPAMAPGAASAGPVAAGAAGGGGGDGGDGKGPSDADRRQQLREWLRNKLIEGDVDGLAERLRSKNKAVREQAVKDYETVRAQVKADHVVKVPEQTAGDSGSGGGNARRRGGPDDSDGTAKDRKISTGGKRSLKDLGLEKLGLDGDDIRDFGEWLKKNHKAGDTGSEVDMNKKATVDGHDHLDTPEQVRQAVDGWKAETQWQKRKGNAKGWHADTPDGKPPSDVPTGKKKGGSGEGGGGATGGSTGEGGGTPGGGETGGGGSAAKALETEANAFKERASVIEGSATRIETDAKSLETRSEVARKGLMQRKLDPDTYFAQVKALEAERAALVTRRQMLVQQADLMKAEAETTLKRAAQAMPKEMAETFGKQTPEQILARGSKQVKGVTGSGLFNVFTAVMTGYDIVKSVQYVLSADNVMDGVERAVEVGGRFAAGAIEGEVLAYLAGGSAAGGFALAMVLQMPSDQGGDSERLEREAQEKAEQERDKAMAHRERMMIGRYLEKTSPGSAEVIEDAVVVHDRKLWDKTVAEFHQLQAAQYAKQYATLRKRAFDLGKTDGRFRSEMAHKGDIEGWKEVKDAYNATTLAMDLFDDYKQGFKAGNAVLSALEDKVTRLAYADAKAGRPKDLKQVTGLPEVGQAIGQGANPMTLGSDLVQTYGDAYDAYVDQHRR